MRCILVTMPEAYHVLQFQLLKDVGIRDQKVA